MIRFLLSRTINSSNSITQWKILLPLSLIVMIAWTVFWIDHANLAGRISPSVTCVLTIVAYQFIAGQDLPKVGYLTYIDIVFLISFLFVFSTFVINIAGFILHRNNKTERAEKLNHRSKIIYPIVYFACVIGLIVFELA
ncbi:MAG: hypothetical protein IIA45_15450 [Bacteroidetes bacterium]|nr:hypothetical protein [Bacteroidota bacterium]